MIKSIDNSSIRENSTESELKGEGGGRPWYADWGIPIELQYHQPSLSPDQFEIQDYNLFSDDYDDDDMEDYEDPEDGTDDVLSQEELDELEDLDFDDDDLVIDISDDDEEEDKK